MPAIYSFPIRLFRRSAVVCALLAGSLVLGGLSCSKKSFNPTDPLGIANKWVYDSMQLYYYWNNEITSQPPYHLPTDQFFKQLLSGKDRFSWIYNDQGSTYKKSTPELFGFHYAIIPHPFQTGQITGVVTMVIPFSRAALFGLERGMFFTKVNGTTINAANQATIENSLIQSAEVTLQLASFNSNQHTLDDSAAIVIDQGSMPQQSVFATRHFVKNNIKAGYLAYYFCNEFEDEWMLQAIQKLRDVPITELILDLRFNPGGSVASVTKLAATLVPAFNPNDIFITYQGNQHGGRVQQSFAKTISFSVTQQGKDMNFLKSLNLGLQRIFILVSGHTASAAELLANNMRPFMQVILIGSKTLGKDEASFKIEDKRVPKQVNWVLMPTVYKIADANGHGNYADGLAPTHAVNEFNQLPLQPLGLPGDKIVDKALQLIYGSTNVEPIELKMGRPFNLFESLELSHKKTGSGYPVIMHR